MFTISKRFDFSASHRLEHLPAGHPCGRLHGHNYGVEVLIQSPILDDRGFCQADYGELEPFRHYIDTCLDHRHLNDAIYDMRPTAENLARHLFHIARGINQFVVAVRVSETPKTWAEFRSPS